MDKTVGFVGLGIMGKPMAINLVKAGYKVYGFDLNKGSIEALQAAGGMGCGSIREVTEQCGLIITMLPNSPHVKQAVLGEGGIASSAKPGTLIVDMSSIAPGASKEIAQAIAEKGIHMIDAPVSGGEPKAVDGTLAIMVGGAQAHFDMARPLFDVLGSSAVLVGDIGSGNTCKLANQVIVALNIAALSEGLLLAKCAGADPERVFEAIKGGLAGSTVMNAKTPMMLQGNFQPGFRIELHIKDMMNALDAGYQTGAPMPLSAMVMQMFQTLKNDDKAQLDHSALALYYEKLTDETLKGSG